MRLLAVSPMSGENPTVCILLHFPLLGERVAERGSYWLLALPGLGPVDPNTAVLEVDLIITPCDDLAVPHCGIETEHHEQPGAGILVFHSRPQKPISLLGRQDADLLPCLTLLGNFRNGV